MKKKCLWGLLVISCLVAAGLPKYDPDGRLYTYTMVEKSITLKDPEDASNTITVDLTDLENNDNKELFNSIFSSASISAGTYLAKNSYILDQDGELTVQKWLKLAKEGDSYVYPAVTVELTRTYSSGDGSVQPEVVGTHTWTSEEVKDAFEEQSLNDGWVLLEAHTFSHLPKAIISTDGTGKKIYSSPIPCGGNKDYLHSAGGQ